MGRGQRRKGERVVSLSGFRDSSTCFSFLFLWMSPSLGPLSSCNAFSLPQIELCGTQLGWVPRTGLPASSSSQLVWKGCRNVNCLLVLLVCWSNQSIWKEQIKLSEPHIFNDCCYLTSVSCSGSACHKLLIVFNPGLPSAELALCPRWRVSNDSWICSKKNEVCANLSSWV